MLRQARTGKHFYTDRYELVVSDPTRDMKKHLGRQCLSLIELKPERPNKLHMLATYRNHHYVRKSLGNILGLAELQAFIAREAGFEVGTLTLSSTSATLETVSGAWGKNDVRKLINACDEILVRKLAA
jgi:thymidylate synthase